MKIPPFLEFLAGFLFPILITLFFFYKASALGELLEQALLYNFQNSFRFASLMDWFVAYPDAWSHFFIHLKLEWLRNLFISPLVAFFIIFLMGIMIYRPKNGKAPSLFFVSLLGIALLFVDFPSHSNAHLIPALVPLSIVLPNLFKKAKLGGKVIVVFLLLGFFYQIVYGSTLMFCSQFKGCFGERDNSQFFLGHVFESKYKNLTDYVRQNTPGNEKIYSFPSDYGIYLMTQRDTIKNSYSFPWVVDVYPSEIISELENVKYVVWLNETQTYGRPSDIYAPKIYEYITQNYELLKEFPEGSVLMRKK